MSMSNWYLRRIIRTLHYTINIQSLLMRCLFIFMTQLLLLLPAVTEAADTLTVFGEKYQVYRQDSSFIYLNAVAKQQTIRLKYYSAGSKITAKPNSILDSCFFGDADTVICPVTGTFSVRNSFCRGNLVITQQPDSLFTWRNSLSAITGFTHLPVLDFSGVAANKLMIERLFCDSLLLNKNASNEIRMSVMVVFAGFDYSGNNSRQIVNFSYCHFYKNAFIAIAPKSAVSIQYSEIFRLRIRPAYRTDTCYFSAVETSFDSLIFTAPYVNAKFVNTWVRENVTIENVARFIALRAEKKILNAENMGNQYNDKLVDFFKVETGISLSQLKMMKGTTLVLPLDLNLSRLDINNYSIANASIRLTVAQGDLLNEYEKAVEYFEKLIDYYHEKKDIPDETRKDITEWLAYQQTLYQEKQVATQSFSVGKIFRLVKMKFLRLTVNYGYKGEWKFTYTLLLFILAWSIVYLSLFAKEVVLYIYSPPKEEKNHIQDITQTQKDNISLLKLFFMCCWFSFIVFANPKFPSQYFLFSKRMFKWLLVEWMMGLFLLILFIVYIASKYSFIQKLFGF
jgi:tetratricopeptide (TPR) repeat protein